MINLLINGGFLQLIASVRQMCVALPWSILTCDVCVRLNILVLLSCGYKLGIFCCTVLGPNVKTLLGVDIDFICRLFY